MNQSELAVWQVKLDKWKFQIKSDSADFVFSKFLSKFMENK